MAAGPWLATNATRTNLINGTLDLDTDNFRMVLVASTGNLAATSTTYAALTGELNGNGYTLTGLGNYQFTFGGTPTAVTMYFGTAQVWTATGAGITAKWAAIYEVSGSIVAYCLLDSGGADVTATSGNTLTVTTSNSNPVFTLQ